MTAVLVLCSIATILSLLIACLAGAGCFFAMRSALNMQAKMSEYAKFFDVVLQTLHEDTYFLRSEHVRAIQEVDVPQYKELNRALYKMEADIEAIRKTMTETHLLD